MSAIFFATIYYAAGVDQVGAWGEQALSLADKYTLSWVLNVVLALVLFYVAYLMLTDRLITRRAANERVAKEREIGEAKEKAAQEKLELYKSYRNDVESVNEKLYQALNHNIQRVEVTTKIAENLKPAQPGKEGDSDVPQNLESINTESG